MKIFHSINDFSTTKKTILTLGTFDGVHLGHKKILQKLTQNTANREFESLVLTFFPHPRMVLQGGSTLKLLNTITEKVALIEELGIENIVIHPFDEAFSRLTAEEFVRDVLVEKFKIHKIIIGYDHRFGRNRTADINDLIGFGDEYGFEVEQISVQEINDISVSSTKIRTALLDGNMSLANSYLGYDYFLTGTVVKGKQLGRTIGYPTANLQIAENFKLVPQNGVYIVQSQIQNKLVYGMMNIGTNPTVGGQQQSIEVNFIDFEGDLYQQEIQVAIVQRIRSEKKFDSIEDLKNQLHKDEQTVLEYINKI
ncbi:bifunctional riboflavin kinase/FAD synthetase [Flavobacterium sp. GNP001]